MHTLEGLTHSPSLIKQPFTFTEIEQDDDELNNDPDCFKKTCEAIEEHLERPTAPTKELEEEEDGDVDEPPTLGPI